MTTSSGRPGVLTALPVALLLGLIAFHGYQVVALEDDPQRGGAFAMFATVDIGATRTVLATADGGTVELELPEALAPARGALLDRPTEDAATDFATSLLERAWSVEGGRATASATGGTTFGDVRVQVVGFDADGHTITRQVLADVVVGP